MEKSNLNYEKELSKNIFDIYVNSSTKNVFIKECKQFCKEKGYVFNEVEIFKYIELYLKEYASYEERRFYDSIQNKKSNYKFVIFCNDLLSVQPDKRNEFLDSCSITLFKVRSNINLYLNYLDIKGVDVDRYKKYFDKILNDYENYKHNMFDSLGMLKNRNLVFELCDFFEEQINMKFYITEDYIGYLSENNIFNLNSDSMCDLKRKYRDMYNKNLKKLKELDEDKYEFYISELNKLKLMEFDSIKDKVSKFILCLHDGSVDIVDYYLIFNMSFDRFCSIVQDKISIGEKEILGKFCVRYGLKSGFVNYEYNRGSGFCSRVNITEDTIKNQKYSLNDKELMDEDKEYLIDFMNKYNIPFQFFNNVAMKFLNDPEVFCSYNLIYKK